MADTTHIIPDQNMPALTQRIERLDRKAAKLGCAAIQFAVLGAFWIRVQLGEGRTAIRTHTVIDVAGEAPSYNGWTFVAKIVNGAFLGDVDGCLVSFARHGDHDVPARYHQGKVDPNHCAHCGTSRSRKDTFVLRRGEGKGARYIQVGRSCLKDFLGHSSPEALAKLAESILTLDECLGDFEESDSWGGCELTPLADYLPHVARDVRVNGFAKRGDDGASTADRAWLAMRMPILRSRYGGIEEDRTPEAQDRELAGLAMAWADTWADNPRGDYMTNLAAAYRSGVVSGRTKGLLASLTVAYARDVGRKLLRKAAGASEYVGQVKAREVFALTVAHVTGWEGDYGYTNLYSFTDGAGNCLVWKTGRALYLDGPMRCAREGDRLELKATVKSHQEYKGVKQTTITRAALVDVIALAA